MFYSSISESMLDTNNSFYIFYTTNALNTLLQEQPHTLCI